MKYQYAVRARHSEDQDSFVNEAGSFSAAASEAVDLVETGFVDVAVVRYPISPPPQWETVATFTDGAA
jgi:hypothetical protein